MLTGLLCLAVASILSALPAAAETLSREQMAELVMPPFELGERLNGNGVWSVLNSGGAEAGYVFETEPLAPLPGFSGAPINVLVMLDLEGQFVDVRLISHNEPIFVSGLGEAPFHAFFSQYRGHSISDSITVGVPYGAADEASSLVYLDGVSKATASVRIAHQSVLAATLAVAREKMKGIATSPPAEPDMGYREALTWEDLVAQGLATRRLVTNAEIDEAFDGTLWQDDDPQAGADPEEPYLDLWIVDIGPPSIARAVLDDYSYEQLQEFLTISPHDEPILVIDAGRHGLVSEDFVRNTSPDLISAQQDGLPVALRDADLIVETAAGVPEGTAMILRTDRRLGFDPTREWTMTMLAVRKHGSFMPEVGTVELSATHKADARFFTRPQVVEAAEPWVEALYARQMDMAMLALFVGGLAATMGGGLSRFAGLTGFTSVRLWLLAGMLVFVGWYGQGQLSIVTVIGVIRTAFEGGSFDFLLYDPFSLLLWGVVLASFFVWGRGFFCGWLCPFGALQEIAHHVGQRLKLPQLRVSARADRWLKKLKYVLLLGLILSALFMPALAATLAEIEPFKTSITVYFLREWYYVAYAALWLLLGMVFYKGFCRYVCPLGAFMAIGGLLRSWDWIKRREACGSPCRLCTVRCKYQAIERSGKIDYSECFQCLDCVKIHDDRKTCVPLVLADKRAAA